MSMLPPSDLQLILRQTSPLWEELRGQRLFLTGGTGFFGAWLVESFIYANDQLNLNANITILTRKPAEFALKSPHLASHPAVTLHEGDVRTFIFPDGKYSHVIHAATEASAALNKENPLLMLDTIIEGTKRTLEFARAADAKQFLLVSSGAVYGRQPPEMSHIAEEYAGALSQIDAASAYAVGKYTAEHMGMLYAKQHGINVKIARCFAFVGPHLPLDTHFAIGNFILDGLNGRDMTVQGDGTPLRSYLYAADLAIWLWTILFKGKTAYPYNVGSDEAYSIAELARLVAEAFDDKPKVTILKKAVVGVLPERYVPSIRRAREELKLEPLVSMADAIVATKNWYLAARGSSG